MLTKQVFKIQKNMTTNGGGEGWKRRVDDPFMFYDVFLYGNKQMKENSLFAE